MAYAPPNEDTVCVAGGLGTFASASNLNGGGATKAAWDTANDPTKFIGTNGGYISFSNNASFTTATKIFTSTGIGTGVIVGTLVNVFSSGDGAHLTPGRYEITDVVDADNIECLQVDDDGNDDVNIDLFVGGALKEVQEALDVGLNDGSSYNRYIFFNGQLGDGAGTATVTATVKADTYSGTASTKVYFIGYNSTLTAEASCILTTTTDLTGAGAAVDRSLFAIVTVDYLEYRSVDFNAGGKDSNRAMYAMYCAASGDGGYSTFSNCKFRGAEAEGVLARSGARTYRDCEFNLNGTYGFNSNGSIYDNVFNSCSIHDNDSTGMYWRPYNCMVIDTLIYDNGKDGTGHGVDHSGGAASTFYDGNTIYGNARQCRRRD
jgi:hypothetical protein